MIYAEEAAELLAFNNFFRKISYLVSKVFREVQCFD